MMPLLLRIGISGFIAALATAPHASLAGIALALIVFVVLAPLFPEGEE